MAVLRANIAACHVKLAEWKSVVEQSDKGLEHIEDCEREVNAEEKRLLEDKVTEVEDEDEAARKDDEDKARRRRMPKRTDLTRIKGKLLLRRAKARMEIRGWAALQGALEGIVHPKGGLILDLLEADYTTLSLLPNLTTMDRKTVQNALRTLPPRLDEAKQQEMGEMMGKLKQLGNGLLKPFGLSTDNFNMVKDEKTGGYNVAFDQTR